MDAVRHEQVRDKQPGNAPPSLLVRKRFQFAGALVLGALLPWALRGAIRAELLAEPATLNAMIFALMKAVTSAA